MEVELLIKVAGIGMIVAVLCQVLSKAGRDEQSTLLSISGIVIILLIVIEKVGELISMLKEVFGL
ncbi:MAG: stage III sporulation protein AC [Clostridia bacterium]|nr:stage III sporulation protein AC [Clostridia bacterium]MBR3680837.1 stage III sporulation protein AC [Clostridia bacterium]